MPDFLEHSENKTELSLSPDNNKQGKSPKRKKIQDKESKSRDKKDLPVKEKKKKRKFLKIFSFFAIFLITSLAVFSSQVLVSEKSSSSWFSNLPIIKQIRNLAESADRQLKGEKDDRINILLLGIGGIQHEGG